MRNENDDIYRQKQASDAEAALDNHNAELSETKDGYIYVTGASDRESRPDIRAKKARRADAELAQLSMLQQLLSDPVYAKAYQTAKDTIADFKQHMAERLEQLDHRIEALDGKLEDIAPGSAEHKRVMREREGLQRRQQELLDYYNDNIRPIEERMDDPTNPPSEEELDELNDTARQDMKTIFAPVSDASEPIGPVQTANLDVPTL